MEHSHTFYLSSVGFSTPNVVTYSKIFFFGFDLSNDFFLCSLLLICEHQQHKKKLRLVMRKENKNNEKLLENLF